MRVRRMIVLVVVVQEAGMVTVVYRTFSGRDHRHQAVHTKRVGVRVVVHYGAVG